MSKKQPAAQEAKAITDYCFEKGLIVLSCGTFGNVLRFMMPLDTSSQKYCVAPCKDVFK